MAAVRHPNGAVLYVTDTAAGRYLRHGWVLVEPAKPTAPAKPVEPVEPAAVVKITVKKHPK